MDGKNGKKFRGSRDGGVGAYASFFVFAHATDGAIEAYPLHEWYNFQPIHRYKALSAEEAEHEFGRRNKTMNFFSLMMQQRLRDEDGEGSTADAEEPRLPGKKSKELRITDADDIMMDSGDESSDSDDGNGKKREDPDSDNDKKKAKKNLKKKKSKKQKDSDDEAFEDSDDGDEEGREVDYIESSSDESDLEMKTDKQMKSVAEEDGLRKLLTSDESSDEEKNSSDESNKEDKKELIENDTKTKKKKNLSKKAIKDGDKKESLSDLSSNSEDSDNDSKKKTNKFNGNSASNSRSASPCLDGNSSMAGPSGLKRKIQSMPTDLDIGGNSNGASENSNSPMVTPAKKAKYDAPQVLTTFTGAISGNRE